MKTQHPTYAPTGFSWCRCARVNVIDGNVVWKLRKDAQYTLLDAYSKRPHLQLAEATTDDKLIAFVRAWGPLRRIPLEQQNKGSDPLADYRGVRDYVAASLRLIDAVSSTSEQRSAIRQFVEAKHWYGDTRYIGCAILCRYSKHPRGLDAGLQDHLPWLESAPKTIVQRVCEELVYLIITATANPQLAVVKGERGPEVQARVNVFSLPDALLWMIWRDIDSKVPTLVCEECHRLYQPNSRHETKFCKEECAKRKHGREYQKRRRAKARIG